MPVKALLFAAGRGERMRPRSDAVAKPLLRAGGRRLIEWQIESLVRAGVREIVVNTAHLAHQFEDTLGDGGRYGVRLRYSREGERAEDALETLGGIVHALPLLGTAPFIAASSDVVTDYDYARLADPLAAIARGRADAHLVLVDNPPSHADGDMGLAGGRIRMERPFFTYGNIGIFSPTLFDGVRPGRAKLFPWLYPFVEQGRVSGEHFRGRWHNVGTPAELDALDAELSTGGARGAVSSAAN
jgi:N-acetyl-alpha-D-muramate 1-phosphate uridylyltransferase